METRKLCAYNLTRECFLGLEITESDLSYADLKERMSTLTLKSGEGMWLKPFRGLPDTGLAMPLDLIYLDDEFKAIDVVESYPTFRVAASSPQAASVLALPTHSIYSSQTQPGDRLVLCAAEEMERRLERTSSTGGTVQSAVLLREKPLWSGGPGILQVEGSSVEGRAIPQQAHEMSLLEPGLKEAKPPRSWLERWWSPDPRKAPRVASPGLAAYYWTGSVAAPQSHAIKDISASGLYVVTEERWYPGTLVLMTLQRTDVGEESVERSISVQSRAVRWGSDGVGLQFILPRVEDLNRGVSSLTDIVDKKTLEKFLQKLRKQQED